jgi:hypothetical protein
MIWPGTPGRTPALGGHWDYNPLIAAFASFFQERKSTIHGQIISRLYTTVINVSPTAYKESTKQEREREGEVLKLLSLLFLGTIRRTASS